MKVIVHYFAEALGTIHGTPLVSIELDVSSTMDVETLRYMVCYAADLIEDMIALMTPKEPHWERLTILFERGRHLLKL